VTPRQRVLVVEDEVLVGMLLEEMLSELGYEVAALSTHLDEALILARNAQFDVALLDINLNGRQSFPVAEAIRARGLPKTPKAALSRGVVGTANGTVIVNLPGSTGGVSDGLEVLDDVLDHLVAQVAGGGAHA